MSFHENGLYTDSCKVVVGCRRQHKATRNVTIYLAIRIICITFALYERRSLEAKKSEKE